MNKFTTKVKIIIGNPYVTVPPKILSAIFTQAGKDKGPVPVRGTLNGAPYKQTLVRYSGDWRLYLNGIMLRSAGVWQSGTHISSAVGQQVEVGVEFDPDSRAIPMHPKLKSVLAKDKQAKEAYDTLAPYRKHEINRYIGFLKTDESIDRNIERIMQHLRGEESDALYPLMHRKKNA